MNGYGGLTMTLSSPCGGRCGNCVHFDCVCVCVWAVYVARVGLRHVKDGFFPFFFLRRHHNRPAGATGLITWVVFVIHVL